MIHTNACDVLSIVHPIVQAGMAVWFTNSDLVAAVSNAGGLGILGCLGRSPEDAVAEIRRIRALTDRPFGVNFVLHARRQDLCRMLG
jgi:enoyl-[acyl-carrier protein] reductase II